MAENFQRVGSISNAHVGRDFESLALQVLSEKGIPVRLNFDVEVGIAESKKLHRFDLGSDSPPVLIECKSHRWTSGSNVPSAKMTVWNEVMYYFHCAPSTYRKILFVLRDLRPSNGESLAAYYIRTYSHLIPSDVEIWEFDPASGGCEIVFSRGKANLELGDQLRKQEVTNMATGTADEIRAYVNRVYIEPARKSAKASVEVVSGEVHKDMGLENRMPAVCAALDAKKFGDEYRVIASKRVGPKQSSTVRWLFAIRP